MYTVHGIYRAGQDTAGKKRCGAARRPGARTERLSMRFVRCARGPARSTAADNPLSPSRRVMFRETKKKKPIAREVLFPPVSSGGRNVMTDVLNGIHAIGRMEMFN